MKFAARLRSLTLPARQDRKTFEGMTMATAETKLMTAAEFAQWLESKDGRPCELLAGKPIVRPFGGMRHGFVCANVTYFLAEFGHRTGSGFACTNSVGFLTSRNPDTVRFPDMSFFGNDEPIDGDEEFEIHPPKLAVEVRDADESAEEIAWRAKDLAVFGTPLVWVIDPAEKTVFVIRAGKNDRLMQSDQEITGEDVLPDFHCRAADFFAMPGDRPAS
jgi:Uma2 family endonuclease